jgi:RNA polymerase sigma-70 factor (ECF subfamily)
VAPADDDELTRVLESARAGSTVSFEAIYVALSPSVASYLRLNGAEDVEDLTNEVFAQVHRGMAKFSGDWRSFRSFVFTIAHRRLIDDRRRRRRRPVVADGELHDHPAAGDLEADAVGGLSLAEAMSLVGQLSADQREVLLLRIVSDLSTEEVAQAMGKTPGAIKALQHRALGSLRRVIEAQGVEP